MVRKIGIHNIRRSETGRGVRLFALSEPLGAEGRKVSEFDRHDGKREKGENEKGDIQENLVRRGVPRNEGALQSKMSASDR
jgi:hypothetical protein